MNSATASSPKRPTTAPNTVVCAIGDIHGRLDLAKAAIGELRRMARQTSAERKKFIAVFLGDYIDRGPDSSGVVSHLLAFAGEGQAEVVFLRGNHEQVLLDVIDDGLDPGHWLDFGGKQTMQSYGVEVEETAAVEETGKRLLQAIPASHLEFFWQTKFYTQSGDYLFVHAGLRPDRLLEEQSEADMLWFRYYADERPVHGCFIVHGHSPHARPINGKSRIAIDTEAYASDTLTILRLEGESREFIKVHASEGGQPKISSWEGIDASYGLRSRPEVKPAVAAPAAPRKKKPRSAVPGMLLACAVAAILGLGGLFLLGSFIQNSESKPQAAPSRPATKPAPVIASRAVGAPPASSPSPSIQQPAPIAKPIVKDASPIAPPPEASSPALRGPLAGEVGAAKVQIGALPSAALAKAAFDALAKILPSQIGSKTLEVEAVALGGKTLYRANVTGFTSFDQATAFCGKLREAGKSCLVKRIKAQ